MKLRQQYHFRESEKGLLAWDVLKLIKLSVDFDVIQVPVCQIRELNECYWYGRPQDNPTSSEIANHAKLIYEADLSFPIILCSEGRIMDGMHRVCKAFIEGKESISAVRFDEPLVPDYIGKEPNELPY